MLFKPQINGKTVPLDRDPNPISRDRETYFPLSFPVCLTELSGDEPQWSWPFRQTPDSCYVSCYVSVQQGQGGFRQRSSNQPW